MKYIYIVIKRIIDFIAALVLLVLLSPLFLIVAIAIKIDSKGPVIFKQKRVGKKGKVFNLYKFRSMAARNNPLNFKEENQVTKVGHFIRKWSIDELPQLVNIIKGDMAFIGPRPWMIEYHEYMTEEQQHRSDVLPGITGYAQTKGRNNISVLNKINYDLEYVKKISLWMDIKIVFLTIATVFSRDGAEMTKMGMKKEIDDIKENYMKEQEKNKKKKKK
jgi:lipopolysaccharide/colanic/teichoic acid biosynthesis glycosyltransferase